MLQAGLLKIKLTRRQWSPENLKVVRLETQLGSDGCSLANAANLDFILAENTNSIKPTSMPLMDFSCHSRLREATTFASVRLQQLHSNPFATRLFPSYKSVRKGYIMILFSLSL